MFEPADTVYKEGKDRTLVGPVQVNFVYGIGVIKKLWYCFVFGKDTIFTGGSQTVFHVTLFPLALKCVQSCDK